MRADLDEGASRRRRSERARRRLEADRLAEVGEPVLGVRARRPSMSSPVTVEQNGIVGRARLIGVERREQLVADAPRPAVSARRSDPRSAGRGRRRPRRRRAARRAASARRRRRPSGPVDGGDAEPAPGGRSGPAPRLRVGSSTDTMPPRPCSAMRRGRARGDAGRVGERQRPGDVGGGDLALRVADHGGGLDPEASATAGERDHHREQGRLDDVDLAPAAARPARRAARPRSDQSR